MNWFEVDRAGLAKIVAGRGKSFVIFELLSNAIDEDGVDRVSISLRPIPGQAKATLEIFDNAPNGFRNLSDAWILFAESYKKSDPRKRGRFNLGEKLVLALCDEAMIVSTTGGVKFDEDGRHTLRQRTDSGTKFTATLSLTRQELLEITREIEKVIVPPGVVVTYNGTTLPTRIPKQSLRPSCPRCWPTPKVCCAAPSEPARSRYMTRFPGRLPVSMRWASRWWKPAIVFTSTLARKCRLTRTATT